MNVTRSIRFAILGTLIMATASPSPAKVVINEFVKEQRTGGAGAVANDPREFVELYNSGTEAVDISGWTLTTQRVTGTATVTPGSVYFTDVINNGTVLQPGEYFVMGKIGALTLPPGTKTQDLGTGVELWEDLRASIMELRRGPYTPGPTNSPIEDAVAYDMYQAGNPPPTGVTFYTPTAEQLAETSNGIWGQAQSYDIPESPTFSRLSMSRWHDGKDTNVNGRDFGYLPLTPGASNLMPYEAVHVVPDVTGMAAGTNVTGYNYSFVGSEARVIDVGTQSAINPSVISATPDGRTKAIAVWDTSGGADTVFSKERIGSFDIYAYLDSTPLAITSTDWEAEFTTYGIGTVDPLFGTPNSAGLITTGTTLPNNTQSGNTGVGFLFTRIQRHPNDGSTNVAKLQIVDFGEGGNSVPNKPSTEWTVIEEFDLTPAESGWHRLSITYDETTGEVVALFNDEEVEFTTLPNLDGTFYAAYREGLTGVPAPDPPGVSNVARARPATFTQYIAPPSAGLTGDYNDDGVVDAADYVLWRKGSTLENDDTPGNQPGDYAVWKEHFGEAASAGAGGAVPEPGSMALAVVGLIGAVACRRSRG